MWKAFLAVVAALLAIPVMAQDVPADFAATVQAREAAQRANDSAVWARYTTDDMVNTNDDGMVLTKRQLVERMDARRRNGSPPNIGEDVFDERFRVYGDTIVQTLGGTNRAQGGVRKRYTTVWVKQDGIWKVASVHASRMTGVK